MSATISAAEASVRQLIANGKSKAALDRAKEIHKAKLTATSEELVIDAYLARIRSLLEQHMATEAKSMVDLVRERYPAARPRLDGLTASIAVHSGKTDELLRPLNDPNLTAENRIAIEQAIQQNIFDLAVIANCAALPAEHPLRQAATALQKAFVDVTSGPVTEEALALPEVSRRSPLAPWKFLVRAIAAFYRGDDGSCRQHLEAIPAGSAPARLMPAIRALLGEKPPASVTPAMTELISSVRGNTGAVRKSLEELDRCFESDHDKRILAGIRMAVTECRRNAPGLVERLKQHISVRCAMIGIDVKQVIAVMGTSRHDAYFHRLLARGMETEDLEDLPDACMNWESFRVAGAQEGWFSANGPEAAAIYLHMAGLVASASVDLSELLNDREIKSEPALVCLDANKLFERACVLDPHSEAFSQWLDWARHAQTGAPDRVAKAWSKILPDDIDPLLFLIEYYDGRGAYHSALENLAKAERIDGLHPVVRNMRLRLLAGKAIRQIRQKNANPAEKTVAEMAAMPYAQTGARAAFVSALRYMICAAQGDREKAAEHRAAIAGLLESEPATVLLMQVVAAGCKQNTFEKPDNPRKRSPADRAMIPAAVAQVAALAEEVGLEFELPKNWLVEAAKQFGASKDALTLVQLMELGKQALSSNHKELAYVVSSEGLKRGGDSEVAFLLLRAKSVPAPHFIRIGVCAAAAAELARHRRDTALVEDALGFLRSELETNGPEINHEQAADVLRKEKAASEFPKRYDSGPDYSEFAPDQLCNCPDCRRARGEYGDPSEGVLDDDDPFDDDADDPFAEYDDDDFGGIGVPSNVTPEIARILFEETKKAVARGESLPELMARLLEDPRLPPPTPGPMPKKKKGKRK